MDRNIIHLDLDAFFVAVERRRDGRLRGIPLIIGGSSRRGVVAACSYETRRFGVHSAMPMYQALKLCPGAKVIRGDMEAYTQASHEVTEIIAGRAPSFEKSSIDEFYIDASGMDRYFGALSWAKELRAAIIREARLPISMALSVSKLVSKVATGEFKPNAEVHIPAGTEKDFLGPLGVEKIPMIGKRTASILHGMGIRTVSALRDTPVSVLVAALGDHAFSLWRKAHGEDTSPIDPHSERKSISTQSTFPYDTLDVRRLRSMLISMVEKVTFALRDQHKLTSCVTVKIRYSNFDTQTRQQHIAYTASDDVILRVVLELFGNLYDGKTLLRLVGVRLSGLVHGHYQISLFEDTAERVHLYQSIDHIRHKFGAEKVRRADSMEG